jgi:hypothetical protein
MPMVLGPVRGSISTARISWSDSEILSPKSDYSLLIIFCAKNKSIKINELIFGTDFVMV